MGEQDPATAAAVDVLPTRFRATGDHGVDAAAPEGDLRPPRARRRTTRSCRSRRKMVGLWFAAAARAAESRAP